MKILSFIILGSFIIFNIGCATTSLQNHIHSDPKENKLKSIGYLVTVPLDIVTFPFQVWLYTEAARTLEGNL